MAFSIDDFRAALDKYGGLARPNIFQVEFYGNSKNTLWVDPKFNNRDVPFFCQTITFPGTSVNTFEYRPNNLDIQRAMPVSIGYQQLECVFMIDNDYNVMDYLHTWMMQIVNYSGNVITPPSASPSTTNLQPYEIGYKKDYSQTMQITSYSKSPGVSSNGYKCILYDVHPVQVGSVNLEWDNNQSYMTVPVSFSYSKYNYSTSHDMTTAQ